MKDRIIFFIKYYFPVLVWVGVIFFFSSVPNLQVGFQNTAEEIVLRKAAHFGEFVILAILLWRIFYVGYRFQVQYAFWWAFIFAALYGASDELHQTFVIGRTGKVIDAFYDAASALFILGVLAAIFNKKLAWKNVAIVLFSIAMLVGLEYKMISETKSFDVSFSRMKKDLGYMIKHELDFVRKRDYLSQKDVVQKTDRVAEITQAEDSQIEGNPMPLAEPTDKTDSEIPKTLPESVSIDVPFTSQAPLGVWDEIHEDTCEEASVVMLEYYSKGEKLTPDIAEKELQKMVKFEIDNYGDYKDTNAAETVKLAQDFYGLNNLKVVYDFSKSDIKKYLALGKPIIIPAAGRLLGNPYYTPPGPPYHNLVLTGYDGDKIITNDPGTKRGAGYTYDIDTLYMAIHDFPGNTEDMEQGRKAMIVME